MISSNRKENAAVIGVLIFPLLAGLIAHIVFYPVVESWNNNRIRKLGRPAIGVMINMLPFVLYRSLFRKVGENQSPDRLLFDATAYLLSFGINGLGVVLGYLLDDVMEQDK